MTRIISSVFSLRFISDNFIDLFYNIIKLNYTFLNFDYLFRLVIFYIFFFINKFV